MPVDYVNAQAQATQTTTDLLLIQLASIKAAQVVSMRRASWGQLTLQPAMIHGFAWLWNWSFYTVSLGLPAASDLDRCNWVHSHICSRLIQLQTVHSFCQRCRVSCVIQLLADVVAACPASPLEDL